MVRTFVKHSPEVEDFPELMSIVRTVFDSARALETRRKDPVAYLHMLRKKIGKLRAATDRFRRDAEAASAHTNFKEAVASMEACIAEWNEILQSAPVQTPPGPAADDDDPE
ncbi:MAG TPA: amidohydrolase [Planctomycetaceae bacterium]|nr:amidohydrolase [Planctomycetaceae bacterium]